MNTMARRRRKKKTNKWQIIFICIAVVVAIYYLRPWDYIEEDITLTDSEWPEKDLTAGKKPYSTNYDGIDISHHQGRLHWDVVKKNRRIEFIYIKATEGRWYRDSRYFRNIRDARKADIMVGSYHFLRKGSGKSQFAHFRRVVDRSKQDLLPMVDVESDGTRGMSRSEIQKTLRDFIAEAKQYYGKSPIIYTNEAYYKKYLSPEFDNYYLFIANYSREPKLPGKVKYDIWQFSEKGRVRGIWTWVDLNRFAPGRSLDDIKL